MRRWAGREEGERVICCHFLMASAVYGQQEHLLAEVRLGKNCPVRWSTEGGQSAVGTNLALQRFPLQRLSLSPPGRTGVDVFQVPLRAMFIRIKLQRVGGLGGGVFNRPGGSKALDSPPLL